MIPYWMQGAGSVFLFVPTGQPLLMNATGGFPVPGAIAPQNLPVSVKESMMRTLEASPKPSVTLTVMGQTQHSMIAPDLPFRANVPGA